MIFDANVRLGRLGASRGVCYNDAGTLLSNMDALGIFRSLVYSALARESDFIRGNRLLLERIDKSERLVPCWTYIPNREPAAFFVREMERNGVAAVRLFPNSGHFSIRPWCIGELASALSEVRKPLFLDFERMSWSNDGIDWEGIYQLCGNHPGLSVVVLGVTNASPTNYHGIIHKCRNLYIEISQLSCPGAVKRLVDEGLSDRVIFGSGMPTRHPGAPLSMIAFSDIEQDVRRKILHGNLDALLPSLNKINPSECSQSPPRIEGVIDTHVHLGGWNNSYAASGTPEETVKEMDRCGVRAVIATALWSCFGEVALGNKMVAKACDDFPGRIHGYLTLDPKHPVEVGQQIEQYGTDPRFRGIKLHGETHAVDISDPRCAPILDFANRRKLPLLIHQSAIGAEPWEHVCKPYPNATFIVAHVGGCGPDDPGAISLARLARKTPNLYFDLAATRNFLGFLEELVELAGADKILYGSDYPLMDFAFEFGQIIHARLQNSVRNQILHENAKRLFQIE